MLHSSLMRRACMVLVLAVMLTTLSTWLVYTTMTTNQVIKLRAAELLPRAQSFAKYAESYLDGTLTRDQFLARIRQKDRNAAEVMVLSPEGEVLLCTEKQAAPDPGTLQEEIYSALSGSLTLNARKINPLRFLVLVSVPVRDADNNVVGALLVYSQVNDTEAALSTMTAPLMLALGAVMLLMFALAFVLMHRVVKPLRQMRDISQRMSQGNFDLMADEDAIGEVGQLGASLNRMSRALKKSISDLTFERNRLLHILNSMSEGILAVDSIGNITHMNAALENLFPPSARPDDPKLSAIDEAKVWEAFAKAVSDGASDDFDLEKDGKTIHCLISPVYDAASKIAGALGMFRDVSNEVRLENTRREYVANVSHEMRTPLTAMQGLVEPLRDGLVKDEATRVRYYDIILREIRRLSRLITDIMELSRLQSGSAFIETEVFRVGELVTDLCDRYAFIAEEKGLKLIVESDFMAFPPVESNPDRIEQLLVILLDNAIKYTSEGSVSVGGSVEKDKIIFRVRDTGRGISRQNQEYIFERFYKVDKAHSGMGSGLGLSIAREVLAAMGESIWVSSEEGRGSEFAFTVKRAKENS